ncbi:arginine--tRNA ligase [Patescibacteria group bacterium]|nr:MAG: arginine--tRNA ligase [Patescibacteria group bacterium]
MKIITDKIEKFLTEAGIVGEIKFKKPDPKILDVFDYDIAIPCFNLKTRVQDNAEGVMVAQRIVGSLKSARTELPFLDEVKQVSSYVNITLNAGEIANLVLRQATKKDFGASKTGKGKKVMVEFAHPNTHKQFHIGHLRNICTGESVARILENAGHKVIRANYQGDVGMHIAKCLWGILKFPISNFQFPKAIDERVKLLGEAYAKGALAYEESELAKKEIEVINEKIYSKKDKDINKLYKETREWSLEYFGKIYKRVGSKFDRLYFESETFAPGKDIVLVGLNKGIFKESQGAVIFEGEKYGLHNRVFLNSRGLPVYEAKDLALARLQFQEYKPEYILHVVAKEQTDYFKVVFKAMEFTLPESKGREKHLVYGWVSLKEGKMSSRSGNVVLGEWLLDEVKKKVAEAMKEHNVRDREGVLEKVAMAAVKYAFLRTSISNDIVFDINQSVSLTGDSGPYLQYIVARISSILKKAGRGSFGLPFRRGDAPQGQRGIEPAEKSLLLSLSEFPEVAQSAAEETDPSKIAHYLLGLAQSFNSFYGQCPVLPADEEMKKFRLAIIRAVKNVMEKGLRLLGIESVEEM